MEPYFLFLEVNLGIFLLRIILCSRKPGSFFNLFGTIFPFCEPYVPPLSTLELGQKEVSKQGKS